MKKTKRNPLETVITIIIAFIIWSLPCSIPVAILISNTNREESKEVASINTAFSKSWEEFVQVMNENYSYVICDLNNEDFTVIEGYVKDTDLEKSEITFHEAIIHDHLEEYINGNRIEEYINGNWTYTMRAENIAEMWVYKKNELVKRGKTVEK